MNRSLIVTLLMVAAPALATGQAARNAHEAVVDNRQVALDRAQLERDAVEMTEFKKLVRGLEDAHEDRMVKRYREANARVHAAMQREIEQARRKTAQAGHEVRQDRREWRGERVEADVTGDPRDYGQAIDDRHDLRDDRRDRRARADVLRDMERVAQEAASLENDLVPGRREKIARNEALAREFLSLMQEDAAATAGELSEDRRERREDRRERRTDRR